MSGSSDCPRGGTCNDPEKYDLLLKVTNGGTAAESRAVVFATDAGEFARSSHRLEPGASALVNATIPASGKVRAMLQPADALAEDDEIVLDLAPLRRRRVAADPTCPRCAAGRGSRLTPHSPLRGPDATRRGSRARLRDARRDP